MNFKIFAPQTCKIQHFRSKDDSESVLGSLGLLSGSFWGTFGSFFGLLDRSKRASSAGILDKATVLAPVWCSWVLLGSLGCLLGSSGVLWGVFWWLISSLGVVFGALGSLLGAILTSLSSLLSSLPFPCLSNRPGGMREAIE